VTFHVSAWTFGTVLCFDMFVGFAISTDDAIKVSTFVDSLSSSLVSLT
jgi:hypothetical protein